MSIKIAFVAEHYAEDDFASGGIKVNFYLLKELNKRGFDIDIFSENTYNLRGFFPNVYHMANFTEEKRKEYDYVFSEKAVVPSDITYIHDHSNIYRWKYLMKNAFIYKLFYRQHYKKRLERDKARKYSLLNSKKIIVPSNKLKQDLIENYGIPEEKISVIYPPILNYDEYKEKNISNNTFVFGLSALGFESKGGYVLLKALKKLKKIKKNFKVIIIHDNPHFIIKFLVFIYGINNRVEFINLQKNINSFYGSISFILLPSLVETFGLVVTEAMLKKIPAIVGTRCGASELIEDGKNGFIFDSDSNPEDNLAKVMLQAINFSETEYKKLSQNAYETVKEMTIKEFSNKYIEMFESLIYH